MSLARYKTLAFGISAAFAGLAGGLYAIANTFVNPDTFPIALSIFLLIGVVVGGLGMLSGLVIGAIFIHFLPLWAQGQDLGSVFPERVVQGGNVDIPLLGDWFFKGTSAPGGPAVVYGVVLILLMFLIPNGIAGLFRRAGLVIVRWRSSRAG